MEEVVKRYQDGDPEAAAEIIRAYEPLVYKYVHILRSGVVDFSDPDVLIFISLFISDAAVRSALLGKKPSWEAKKVAQGVASMLSRCLTQLERDELYNELCLGLLELAKRYRDKGKTFAAYIAGAFRYEVYRRVINYLKDPTTFASPYDDSFSTSLRPDDLLPEEDGRLLKRLTRFEKYLLFERYLEGKGIREMARQTGYAPSTISKKISSARSKLRCSLMA